MASAANIAIAAPAQLFHKVQSMNAYAAPLVVGWSMRQGVESSLEKHGEQGLKRNARI
jgi:hypothetical protein